MVKVLDIMLLRKIIGMNPRNKISKKQFNKAWDLPTHTLFPIAFSMLHHKSDEMRVQIVLDQNGDSVWFTMPLKEFNALPELEVS